MAKILAVKLRPRARLSKLNSSALETKDLAVFLAEFYYVTFGLWHEPSVCRLSLCNVAHQAELNFLAIFLHRLIAQELGQFVLKFWKKIQVVSM